LAHLLLRLRRALAQLAGAVVHPVLDAGEALSAEELLQDDLTLVGRRVQEPLEGTLGQHDDLHELLRAHADGQAELVAHLGHP